jgi:NSS family neurotransmitter:Na+ symporter
LPGCLSLQLESPVLYHLAVLSHVHIMGKSIFDFVDFLTSTIGLPLGAFLIALFVSFQMKKTDIFSELKKGSTIKNFGSNRDYLSLSK